MNSYIKSKILGFFVKTNGYFSEKIFSGAGHIITFHRVMPKSVFSIPENKSLEVSPDFLTRLINTYKANRYSFVSLDEIYEILSSKKRRIPKVVAFTFDDGYYDNYKYAYPILTDLSIPMCVYITTDFPDRKAVLWWYLLEYLFNKRDQFLFPKSDRIVTLNCKTNEDKQKAFKEIRRLIIINHIDYIKDLKHLFNINELDFDALNNDFNNTHLLNWQQISEMAKSALLSIGTHTISHPVFKQMSENEIINEIIISKKLIEKHIKKEIWHFAYPYGGQEEVGKREFDILKKLNFRTCVTTRHSNLFSGHGKHLECLPRISIPEGITEMNLTYLFKGIKQFSQHGFKRVVTD